jgi:hypothetical protein
MRHRVEVTTHTPFELTPHGYVRFRIRDEDTDVVLGTLEVRKDRISWRPADKELWLDRSWEQLTRQWEQAGNVD